MRNIIKNLLNGLALGMTQVIPGLSGGTIAVILGFYFELIETINHFFRDLRRSLKLIIPLVTGMAAGIILFGSLFNFLLTNYSFPTMLFFIGLISGIVPHIYTKIREDGRNLKARDIMPIALPFIILLIISFLKETSVTNPAEVIDSIDLPFIIFIFFAGILAAAALIIPGFSGSFVLLLMGIYHLAIYSISSIRILLADFSNLTLLLNICKVLVPLAIGIIIGILSMARLIEKMLKNHQKPVYSVILGLMLGSVCVMFMEPMIYASGISASTVIIGIVTLLAGLVISYKIGEKRL